MPFASSPRRRQTLEELVNEGIESYRQHGGIGVNEQFWVGGRERGTQMAIGVALGTSALTGLKDLET